MSIQMERKYRLIREEFERYQARGMKVDEVCELLSPKYFLSPIRIKDIVYRTQQQERTEYESKNC